MCGINAESSNMCKKWQVIVLLAISLFGLAPDARPQARNEPFRSELLTMEKADQDARTKCTSLSADEQVKCLGDISTSIDEPNTKRLEEIFDQDRFSEHC